MKFKIEENHDGKVHLYDMNKNTPDDLAFGRAKPFAYFETYEEAEAFIDGYDYRLGEMIRDDELKTINTDALLDCLKEAWTLGADHKLPMFGELNKWREAMNRK